MKYLITFLLLVSSLFAIKLQKGMNILGMTTTEILSEGRFRSDIDIIYGAVNGTWQSFNPNKKMAFNGLKELEKGKGYIVVVARVMEFPNATKGIGTQVKCPQLDKGVNIVPMYSYNFANISNNSFDINGSVVNSIFSTKENSYISFNPQVPLPLNSLQQITNGRYYVVDTLNDNIEACGVKLDGETIPDSTDSDILPFDFFPQNDVPRNTFIESNTVLVNIGTSPSSAYVEDGFIVKNGDENDSAKEQFIMNGDKIKIKLLSSSEYDTKKSATLHYKGAKTTFDVTTLSEIRKLPFEFWPQKDIEINTIIESNDVLINIGDEPSSAYVDNGVLIKNGDAENAASSMFISKGDKVRIQALSPSEYSATGVSNLYYRDAKATFEFTTANIDVIPVDEGNLTLRFQTQINVLRNSFITSNEVLVNEGETSTKAYVNQGVIIKNGDINNSSSEQLIKAGDRIQIQLSSSSEYNTTTTATLFYLNGKTSFSVRTLTKEDAKLDFKSVSGAPIEYPVLSNEVLVRFGNTPTEASVNNGLLVKNGDLTTASVSQTVKAGDKIQVQLVSSNEYNKTVVSTVSYLGELADFNVTTLEFADFVPEDFIFESIETNPNRIVISNQVEILDISQALPATAEILYGTQDVTIVQNGVDTLSRTVNVYAGDKINLKVPVTREPAIVKLTVGEKTSNFEITLSDVVDYTPDKFFLIEKNNLDPNIKVFSNDIIISGLDPFRKTYAAALNADVYVNGTSSGNYAMVQNDDIVKLAMQTPAQLGTLKIGQLYIGGEFSEFNITTTSTNPDQDDNPTEFNIKPALNVDVSTYATSEEIVVLGINILATVTLDKGILIVNGVEIPSNQTSVAEFDKVQIKALSSDSYEDELLFNLTIGPVTKSFKVVTKEQPVNILLENQRYRKEQNVTLPLSAAPAAISWGIVEGRLPSGLIFDSDRAVIKGVTADENNISEFTIKATIVNGESSQVKRTIEVGDYISTVYQTPDIDGGIEYDDAWYKNNKNLGVPITFERLLTDGVIQVNSRFNWLDIDVDRMTYVEAKSFCENLEFGGFNSWRLPTIHELQMINGHQEKFDYIGLGFMWSSTPSIERSGWYWYVDFGNGGKSYVLKKTDKAFVKCIVGAR